MKHIAKLALTLSMSMQFLLTISYLQNTALNLSPTPRPQLYIYINARNAYHNILSCNIVFDLLKRVIA